MVFELNGVGGAGRAEKKIVTFLTRLDESKIMDINSGKQKNS